MNVELPSREGWIKGLGDLCGRPFVARPEGSPWVPSDALIAAGVYASDAPGSPPQVIWLMDLTAACTLSAALSMLPPAVAEESIKTGVISHALLENLHEVMNVGAAMVKVTEGRLKLDRVFAPPQVSAELAAEWVRHSRQKVGLDGGLEGLGQGRMYLLSTI